VAIRPALAQLNPGEVVLDLGSGGGIDVLLSARRVGAAGKAYGLDMTDDMLALARENQRKSGLSNVEFLKGEIEHIPLPDASVDVVISNCVINLSADKDRVMAKPFECSVLEAGLPSQTSWFGATCRRSSKEISNCGLAAWLARWRSQEYPHKLAKAGFEEIDVEPTRIYRTADAVALLTDAGH
jgi:SAM-dependent methyltransferase